MFIAGIVIDVLYWNKSECLHRCVYAAEIYLTMVIVSAFLGK